MYFFRGIFFFLQVCISAFNLLMEIICDFPFHKKNDVIEIPHSVFWEKKAFFPLWVFSTCDLLNPMTCTLSSNTWLLTRDMWVFTQGRWPFVLLLEVRVLWVKGRAREEAFVASVSCGAVNADARQTGLKTVLVVRIWGHGMNRVGILSLPCQGAGRPSLGCLGESLGHFDFLFTPRWVFCGLIRRVSVWPDTKTVVCSLLPVVVLSGTGSVATILRAPCLF